MGQAASSSAPPYDPDLWNDKTTPEQRAAFIKDNQRTLVNILAVADRGAVPDESDRYRYQSELERNPGYKSLVAVAGFMEADEKFKGDNKKLAEHFGLDAARLPEIRARMETMGKALGYEDYANCYTYAMNDRDGLASRHKNMGGDEPGTRGGTDPANTDINWDKVRANNSKDYEGYKKALMAGVLADGALDAGQDGESKEGHYRVAVFSKRMSEGSPSSVPNFDMHFMRENQGGGWSHKPGPQPVTDKDNSGKPITDPKTANIGGYDFLGYVYVPEGGLDVGRRSEPASKPGSIRLDESRAAPPPISSYGAFPDLANMAGQMVPPATPKQDVEATSAPVRQPVPSKVPVLTP